MAEYIEREALMRRIKEIHCAECDSYHGVRYRACWVDDTLDYIDSEPAADVVWMEWISVEDRLPENDGSYLVTINPFGGRKYVDVRWFAKDGEAVDEYELAGQENVWYYYDSEWGYISVDSITNWMPLPQPPKGE